MNLFRGSRERRERDDARAELAKAVRNELKNASHRRDRDEGEQAHQFICEDSLQSIWTLQRIQVLSKGLSWDHLEWQSYAFSDFKKVLSTLVWIRWDSWDKFQTIFLNHRDSDNMYDRKDANLPFTTNLQSLLTNEFRSDFLRDQYIFIPVELKEDGRFPSTRQLEFPQRFRMPMKESIKIGEGGQGIVYKELVAAKHFRTEHGHLVTEDFWVATKRIRRADTSGPNDQNYHAEQVALRSLKQCLGHNDNIMHSYTSFIHGPFFVIVSQLADMNLHEFFKGNYEDYERRHQNFTPLDLLREASCLAGALDFLHYKLKLRERKMSCAHLDFKPENILVKWHAGNRTPVGQWLIHDFGTAKIKEPSEDNALAPGDFLAHFSLTKAQRNPGPFQAPEVQPSKDRVVGRESDMWSFGCLLAVVLAFAIGGPPHVTKLAKTRYDRAESGQTRTDYFYKFENGRAILKATLTRWLQSLRTDSPDDVWIGKVLDLIFKMLVEVPNERLKAEDTQDELDAICLIEEMFLKLKCRWIEPEAPIPVVIESTSPSRSIDPGRETRRSILVPANVSTTAQFPVPDRGVSHWATPQHQVNGYSRPNPTLSNQGRQEIFTAYYPAQHLDSRGQSALPNPVLRTPSIIRTDTTSFNEIHPSSPLWSPSTKNSSRSDESSSMGASSSSTADVTFLRLVPTSNAIKSLVCADSRRVAVLSKSSLLIYNFRYHQKWTTNRPKSLDCTTGFRRPDKIECPYKDQGFEWQAMSLCDNYMVLQAKKGTSYKYVRYNCAFAQIDNTYLEIWREDPYTSPDGSPSSEAVNGLPRVLDICVNSRGDTLFILAAAICCYTANMGLHTLETKGMVRGACFSSDGNLIFAWTWRQTQNQNQNLWYMWDCASTIDPILEIPTEYIPAERPGQGRNGLIFPLSTYFAAFEIPNRLYIIGKDPTNRQVVQLKSAVEDIVAGVGYEKGRDTSESPSHGLILVQQNSSPGLVNLPLHSPIYSSTASKPRVLKESFNADTDGIAIVDEDGISVIVSHPKGIMERRKISS